jgi:serine protease Do
MTFIPLARRVPFALLGLTAVVSFLLGLVYAGSRQPEAHPVAPEFAPAVHAAPTATAPEPAGAAGGPIDFATVAARLRPSVVNIFATTRATEGPVAMWRYPRDGGTEPASNSGAGFLIQPAGYVLTNAHVVLNADRVMVTLADNRVLRAEVVGSDPTPGIDVALLKVESNDGLPTVTLGKSSTLRVGDWVCTIGNPLGYMGSVTVGVVSSLNREVPIFSAGGLIQTDAAMSLGSSGGPLVNSHGQVVGITTAIVQSSNIGFAIPIDQVTAVLSQLRERGRVPRGYVSARVTTATSELRRALRLSADHGAVVEEVTPDRAAERAGLRPYDVIEAVDDVPVTAENEFVHIIAARAPGTVVKLAVWRDGIRRVLPLKLEELPSTVTPRPVATENVRPVSAPGFGPLGLSVSNITAPVAKILPDAMSGVIVTEVDAAGPAQMAGLRKGLVVLEVNRRRMATATDFTAAQAALRPGDAVALMLYDPTLREYRITTVVVDSRP